jgi:hypothetical protein
MRQESDERVLLVVGADYLVACGGLLANMHWPFALAPPLAGVRLPD